MEHTPTPWALDIYEGHDKVNNVFIGRIVGLNDEIIFSGPFSFHALKGDANAAFIVRAVNSHDELLAALKGMIEHSSCRCGGFDGREIVPQPCDICEAAQTAIHNATKE